MDKSNKPMTNETAMGLYQAVRRIRAEVESGKTPRLHNAFEKNVYRMSKEWRALGNGNIHKGYESWAQEVKKRDEQMKLDSPVWKLLAEMDEAPNPVHRTLAKIVETKLSLAEFNSLANETLEQEIEKSAQELPGTAPIQPNPNRPWEASRPMKRQRDQIIWEMRNQNYTWDQIEKALNANGLGAGPNTIKENYSRMHDLNRTGTVHKPRKMQKKSG